MPPSRAVRSAVPRSSRHRCDHGVVAVPDRPVHWAEPAPPRQAGDRPAPRGADTVRRSRPSSRPLKDRVLLVAASWCTNLTLHRLAPRIRISKSAADRIINRLAPCSHCGRANDSVRTPCSSWTAPWSPHATTRWPSSRKNTGTPPVTRSSSTPIPGWSSRLGDLCPATANDCKACELSGAKAVVDNTTVIADGGYRATGLVIPHRREPGKAELSAWKRAHNRSHRKVRVRGCRARGATEVAADDVWLALTPGEEPAGFGGELGLVTGPVVHRQAPRTRLSMKLCRHQIMRLKRSRSAKIRRAQWARPRS